MKLNKVSQLVLVSAIGLAVATLLSGCFIPTIDYVFVADSTSNTPGSAGQIVPFAIDPESGALRTDTAAPIVPSGGSQPVSMVVSSDYTDLYVANAGSDSVVHFAITLSTGALTQKDSITTSAPPVYIAVSVAHDYLYVVSGTTSATLSEYSLGSDGSIGSLVAQESLVIPGYASDAVAPTGVAVIPNSTGLTVSPSVYAVYVTVYDQSAYNPGGTVTSNANPGWIFGFVVDPSSGALTAAAGSPYQAGVKPTAVTADPTDRFVYVTDFASNELIGYSIETTGQLSFMINGPFKTGNEPTAVVVDPRGIFIYVANSLQSTVSAYNIALPTGTPSATVAVSGSTTNSTDTDPVAIIVDPALGRYVFTANYLGNTVSGFRLNPSTGVLTATENTPYVVPGANPAAIAAVPHGNHATESVTP